MSKWIAYPFRKISIIPHAKALGIALSLPKRVRYWLLRRETEAWIATMLGSRFAEALVCGTEGVISGGADDIGQAAAPARCMVTTFGFSAALGPLCFAEDEDGVFLGHAVPQQRTVSEATAAAIDQKIRPVIAQSKATARRVVMSLIDARYRLAHVFVARETLSDTKIRALLHGERSHADPVEMRTA